MPIPGPVELLWRFAHLPLEQRIGVNLHQLVARGLGRAFEFSVSIEDLPEESNTVTLHPTLTDSDGIPAPKITYAHSEYSQRALEWNVDRAVEAHKAAGAVEVYPIDWGPDVGWHLLGTARMGLDPSASVVDPTCRAHDVDNLFVVDGSAFVTSGCANPTSTISALAMRAADTIAQTAHAYRQAAA
jgi:choline dehydrogenase-like flavoprotein